MELTLAQGLINERVKASKLGLLSPCFSDPVLLFCLVLFITLLHKAYKSVIVSSSLMKFLNNNSHSLHWKNPVWRHWLSLFCKWRKWGPEHVNISDRCTFRISSQSLKTYMAKFSMSHALHCCSKPAKVCAEGVSSVCPHQLHVVSL